MKIQPIPIAGIDITPPEVSRHHINATSTEISEQEEQLFDGDVFFCGIMGQTILPVISI